MGVVVITRRVLPLSGWMEFLMLMVVVMVVAVCLLAWRRQEEVGGKSRKAPVLSTDMMM